MNMKDKLQTLIYHHLFIPNDSHPLVSRNVKCIFINVRCFFFALFDTLESHTEINMISPLTNEISFFQDFILILFSFDDECIVRFYNEKKNYFSNRSSTLSFESQVHDFIFLHIF